MTNTKFAVTHSSQFLVSYWKNLCITKTFFAVGFITHIMTCQWCLPLEISHEHCHCRSISSRWSWCSALFWHIPKFSLCDIMSAQFDYYCAPILSGDMQYTFLKYNSPNGVEDDFVTGKLSVSSAGDKYRKFQFDKWTIVYCHHQT